MKKERHYKLDLDTNNHSVFKLTLHAIFCVKYRRQVITDEISDFLVASFARIGAKYHVTVLEANHDRDHLHVLLSIWPNTPISTFINSWKAASSRTVKKQFPAVTKRLWKQQFWSQSYCLLTVGSANLETVQTYIESQGEV